MKKKTSIVFFAPRFHTNQTLIVNTLLENGFDVNFLVLKKGKIENYRDLKPTVLNAGIIYRILAFFFSKFRSENFKRRFQSVSFIDIFFYLRKYKPDYIIIRNPDTVPGFFVFLYSLLFLRKKIIFYHQTPYYATLSRRSYIINLLNKVFDTKSYTPVLGNIDKNKSIVTNNYYLKFPVPINYNISNGNEIPECFKILTIAKFRKRKNLPLLIEVLRELKENILLTIVGQLSSPNDFKRMEDLKDLIKRNNLENRVIFKNNIPHQFIHEVYSKHDLFVLPSKNEPFSYSILEAVGNGLPVICSDSCGSRQYVKSGINGYIFRTDDSEDLKNKILAIYNTPYKHMGKIGLQFAKKEYSKENFIKELKKILCIDLATNN